MFYSRQLSREDNVCCRLAATGHKTWAKTPGVLELIDANRQTPCGQVVKHDAGGMGGTRIKLWTGGARRNHMGSRQQHCGLRYLLWQHRRADRLLPATTPTVHGAPESRCAAAPRCRSPPRVAHCGRHSTSGTARRVTSDGGSAGRAGVPRRRTLPCSERVGPRASSHAHGG